MVCKIWEKQLLFRGKSLDKFKKTLSIRTFPNDLNKDLTEIRKLAN